MALFVGLGVGIPYASSMGAYAALIARATLVLNSADALDSAGTLTSWPARVGAAPTVTSAPSVDTDGGTRAVRFNITAGDAVLGTNELLTFAGSTVTEMQAASAGTLVLVARLRTGGSATAGGIANIGNSNDSYYPFTDTRIYDDALATTRKSPSTNPATDMTTRHCYQVDSASAAWDSRINGASYVSTGTNTYFFLSGATLGGRVARGYYGRIFAVYLFPFVLSATDRATLQAYIASTWGVAFS